MLCWLILPLQLFLRNQVGESSKQGIQAVWSTSIHLFKWLISRFKSVYRTFTLSERELFLILLKGPRPLYNVTRSSVLVALPLHFIIIVIIVVVITITFTFIINIIFIIVIIIRIFIKSSLLFLWVSWPIIWFCFFQFLHLS